MSDNVCDACTGTGKPISGKPCMCGGTGKMSDAAVHLRKMLVEAEVELEAVKGDRDDLRRKLDIACREKIAEKCTSGHWGCPDETRECQACNAEAERDKLKTLVKTFAEHFVSWSLNSDGMIDPDTMNSAFELCEAVGVHRKDKEEEGE